MRPRRTSRAGETATGAAGQAATQRLGEEGKGLSDQVEQLEKQRSELEGRVAQLAGRAHKLEATLERERAEIAGRIPELERHLKDAGEEHAREHRYRRQLEDRLATELLSGEELREELESATGAAATLREQVERLEEDLRAARGEALTESAARERLEKNMANRVESEADTDLAGGDEAQEWRFEPLEQAAHNGEEPQPGGVEEGLEEQGAAQGPRAWFKKRRAAAPCAVCQRPPPALGDAELAESGWTLNTQGALCAACQQDGWQFPAGSAAPFRRMGAPAG